MCSALPYAKSLPINHPIISPSLATPELLRGLPPLMLVRCRPPSFPLAALGSASSLWGVAVSLAAVVDLLIAFMAPIDCLSSLGLCVCALTTCALPTVRVGDWWQRDALG